MTQKVFLNDENKATFVCPECNLSTTKEASQYRQIDREVRFKIKCTCGHSYSVLLERRKHFRKETNLLGKYTHHPSSGPNKKGSLRVKNISRLGLKLVINAMPGLAIGSKLSVEFSLDDKQKTIIKKDIVIRMISDSIVGGEFCSFDTSDSSDKALGFYLFK